MRTAETNREFDADAGFTEPDFDTVNAGLAALDKVIDGLPQCKRLTAARKQLTTDIRLLVKDGAGSSVLTVVNRAIVEAPMFVCRDIYRRAFDALASGDVETHSTLAAEADNVLKRATVRPHQERDIRANFERLGKMLPVDAANRKKILATYRAPSGGPFLKTKKGT